MPSGGVQVKLLVCSVIVPYSQSVIGQSQSLLRMLYLPTSTSVRTVSAGIRMWVRFLRDGYSRPNL